MVPHSAFRLPIQISTFICREKCEPSDIPEGVARCLETFAILAVTQNQMNRAASLFSASEELYALLRFEMFAVQRSELDPTIATVCAVLGEEAFSAAWEAGQKMTLDEAVAYALETDS